MIGCCNRWPDPVGATMKPKSSKHAPAYLIEEELAEMQQPCH